MLKIRFSRKGKKKQPTFRIIINQSSKDTKGDYLENLGSYNPRSKETVLNTDRIKYWLSKGAQTSDSIWNLFVTKGVVEGKKHTVTKMSKKRVAKRAETEKKIADEKAAVELKKSEAAKAEAAKNEVAAEPVKAEEPKQE
jgi:small subunit ribosomal protein S16